MLPLTPILDRSTQKQQTPIFRRLKGQKLNLPIVALLLLSGCTTTQTPVTVKIPVPVPCVKADDLPKPPAIKPDAELAKLDDAKLILTIASERLDLKRYHGEASALLTACVK